MAGWGALDAAVIFGNDARVDQECPDYLTQVRLKWKHYAHQMKFLDADDHVIAYRLRMDWQEFSDYLRINLIRSSISHGLNVPSEKRKLIAWTKKALALLNAPQADQTNFLTDPVRLLRFAYRGLNSERASPTTRSLENLYRLILIGVAHAGINQMELCAFCYRWAAPSHVFCAVHGQKKINSGTPSDKAKRYRQGTQATTPNRWRNEPPIPSIYLSNELHGFRFAHGIRMANILWSAIPKAEEELRQKIMDSLAFSPLVCRTIGDITRLKIGSIDSLLRAKLDPLELVPDAWPDKIRFAEEWMRTEAVTLPGARGPSSKTNDRIALAEELALSGQNLKAIAETLKINRVAILNWCSRGRAPRLKEILEAQRSTD